MNKLLENNIISELECGNNFAYILNENSSFLTTEYKVLQNQNNKSFVSCMKMTFNGRTELLYLTENLKAFSGLISNITPDVFIAIITNLFSCIIETKSNGFLSCKNIDSSFDKIFVDMSTNKVKLIYLPTSVHFFENDQVFESELRINLIKLISNTNLSSSAKIMQLSSDLQNGMLTLENIYSRFGGKYSSKTISEPKPEKPKQNTGCKLIAIGSPQRIELTVDKDEYVIGKKDTNDGIVTFNKMISRVHCKITKKHEQYWITDLQSANGTYVNHTKLQANQAYIINNGDVVRMADSDFQVIIG